MKGTITVSEAATIGMPPSYLNFLTKHRVLNRVDESTYSFTYNGVSMVRMLHSNPNIAKLLQDKTQEADHPDHMFG